VLRESNNKIEQLSARLRRKPSIVVGKISQFLAFSLGVAIGYVFWF